MFKRYALPVGILWREGKPDFDCREKQIVVCWLEKPSVNALFRGTSLS